MMGKTARQSKQQSIAINQSIGVGRARVPKGPTCGRLSVVVNGWLGYLEVAGVGLADGASFIGMRGVGKCFLPSPELTWRVSRRH